MLVLLIVSWLLIGIGAAWIGKVLSSDILGWLGFGLFGIAGAIAGGMLAMGVSDAFFPGVFGGVIGAVAGVMLRGAAEEIRSRGPGLAV
ncbi:MAG TPA: hypothetical protein VM388_07630 [Acidimicrobiales bacterium]|nr:hypothetical protein [Acidimicrobiales bacterium]